jgi:hypothetical protein
MFDAHSRRMDTLLLPHHADLSWYVFKLERQDGAVPLERLR